MSDPIKDRVATLEAEMREVQRFIELASSRLREHLGLASEDKPKARKEKVHG